MSQISSIYPYKVKAQWDFIRIFMNYLQKNKNEDMGLDAWYFWYQIKMKSLGIAYRLWRNFLGNLSTEREESSDSLFSQVLLQLRLRCGEERVSLIERANSRGRKKERQRGCRARPGREGVRKEYKIKDKIQKSSSKFYQILGFNVIQSSSTSALFFSFLFF